MDDGVIARTGTLVHIGDVDSTGQSPSFVLRRYEAFQHLPAHTDDFSCITFAVRGQFCEEGRSGTELIGPGDVVFKSRRAVHEDRFGAEGAVLASLVFSHDDNDFDGNDVNVWQIQRDGKTLAIAVSMLESALAGDAAATRSASADLLASLDSKADSRARPPPWLQRIKDDLAETNLAGVDVSARAREAGVHAVHASRLFRRCFGLSITEHGLAQTLRRALKLLAAEPPMRLSEIALDAGFYDQCHMNRVFRRILRTTPGVYRAMLARLG